MIKNDLKEYAGLLGGCSELRVQENRLNSISFANGSLMVNENKAVGGVSARVFKGGAWGFASSPGDSEDAIKKVLSAAGRNADFLDSRLKRGRPQLPAYRAEGFNDYGTKKQRLSRKELVDYVQAIDAHVAAKYPGLKGRKLTLSGLDMEKAYLNSFGSCSYSLLPRSSLMLSMFVEKDGQIVDHYKVNGNRGHFEDVLGCPEDLYAWADAIYEELRRKAEGVYPDAGRRECVLDATLTCILAHEAVGHTTEADLVLGGSVAGDCMGKQVAAPIVNLTDFAHTALGQTCRVPVHVDDEGAEAKDAVIIKDGVLRSFMHNRESADHFGAENTGNARAYEFSDEPLIRMRNTAILPGKDKLEAMIASLKDGYYLVGSTNGQADSTSEFTFGVKGGYEVKNGKLGRALRGATVSGVAFEMLKTVSMVSDEMYWSASGYCGKKQMIPVSMGGPALKCMINIGGR
jgi:TldD protein